MIDYLKIESELKPFGWKEYQEEYANFEGEIAFYFLCFFIFSFTITISWLTWMCFFDKKGNPDALPSPLIIGGILLYYVFSFGVFFITLIFLPEWKLESKKNILNMIILKQKKI